jgi:hypothetical protein
MHFIARSKDPPMAKTVSRKFARIALLLCAATLLYGCTSRPSQTSAPPVVPKQEPDPIADLLASAQATPVLNKMGFSIQVGAFAALDNAVRLERLLETRGIDAYYFRHASGLFKVRFGNHADYGAARNEAADLQAQGLIERFFIVIPEDYAAARIQRSGKGDLRRELVETARRFLGVPYRWGGADSDQGFDCSGLTMVCYRLNGLNLPRNSRSQFSSGRRIPKERLRQGDLVFFATNGGRRVSHVGMFIGSGRFIHAPRTGKTVRIEKLSNPFFSKTYMGARSYL